MAKTNKTKKLSKNNRKIKVDIDWNSADNGYSALYSDKVFKFVMKNINDGYNLIQTQENKPFHCNGKSVLYLQAVKVKSWAQTPEWEKTKDYIKCEKYNDWIKTTPCKIGTTAKVFVTLKSNPYIAGFSMYLINIFSGHITLDKHKEFVKAIQKTFRNKPIRIHNQDVDWFHMKEYIV